MGKYNHIFASNAQNGEECSLTGKWFSMCLYLSMQIYGIEKVQSSDLLAEKWMFFIKSYLIKMYLFSPITIHISLRGLKDYREIISRLV